MNNINKSIDLTKMPMRGKLIDWKNSIGLKCNFIYDDISGEIEIANYLNNRKISVLYNGNYFDIDKNQLKNCNIGNIIGTRNTNYIYGENEIINTKNGTIKIIKQIRIKDISGANRKGYTVKCMIDNYVYDIFENRILDGDGCPVCSNQIVVKGINDIATTHPQYVDYFINIDDTYTHSYGSKQKVWVKCPRCSARKFTSIDSLTGKEFTCPQCSDGVSYPNKFVFNFLNQIYKIQNIDFYPEKVFDWAKDKRYDEFIPSLNIIIENHGRNHYEGGFENFGGRTYEEERKNDILKKKLALSNYFEDFKYIELDCRYSNLEWIKTSIMKSNLPLLLNFKETDINWDECNSYALKSRIAEIANMWNEGFSKKYIANKYKLKSNNITTYLKQAAKIKLCNYDIEYENKRSAKLIGKSNSYPIYCINNNIYYDSIELASKLLNCDSSQISRVLSGKYKHTHGFKFERITQEQFNQYKLEGRQCFGDFFILNKDNNKQQAS